MADPILCCEEENLGGVFVERLAASCDRGLVSVLRQQMWRRSDHESIKAGVWETDPDAGISVRANHLPALINALLRLCTHAQLGEVVVPRWAGEWKRGELCAERIYVAGDEAGEWQHFENRHQAADGLPFTAGWTAEAPVMAVSYSSTGGSVTTWHPTSADAEAAVDERLRADGVVLP